MAYQGYAGHRGPHDMYMESGYGMEDGAAAAPVIAHQQQVQREQEHMQDLASGKAHKASRYRYVDLQQLIKENPSVKDGLDPDKEKTWRRQYCKLIQEAGVLLKIPQWAIAVGITLCHRFFAVKSMKRNDRFLIATACLFLAAKVEESPKQLKQVIFDVERVRHAKNIQAVKALEDPTTYERVKEEVLQAERAVLYTLGFDLKLTHPYKTLMDWMNSTGVTNLPPDSPHKPVPQNAWNLVNDSLRTTLCLQFQPQKIAATAIWMADVLNAQDGAAGGVPLLHQAPGGVTAFFNQHRTRPEEVLAISRQMLAEYEHGKAKQLAALRGCGVALVAAEAAGRLGPSQLARLAAGGPQGGQGAQGGRGEEEEGEVKD